MLLIKTLNILAYIDPGSGSYLVQLLVAGVLGAGYALKLYWAKFKSFFTRRKEEPTSDETREDQ